MSTTISRAISPGAAIIIETMLVELTRARHDEILDGRSGHDLTAAYHIL